MSYRLTRRSFPVLRASRYPWRTSSRRVASQSRLMFDANISRWQAKTLIQFGTCIATHKGKRVVYILEQGVDV